MTAGSGLTSGTFSDGSDRNYTYLYDKNMYTAMWVAYPLYSATYSGTNKYSGSWRETPGIPDSDEINVWSASYNVVLGQTTYVENAQTACGSDGDYYAKGHQIPDADRQYDEEMVKQTYYAINSTPQIQKKFNGSMWSRLESAVRTEADKTDILYVTTGPLFNRKDQSLNEEVIWITPKGDPSKKCPVPNYYWKVLLKVRYDSEGEIASACTIGFWFEHKQYDNSNYAAYAESVNVIERRTGLDLFTNLPDGIEESVEGNSNWQTFQNFSTR